MAAILTKRKHCVEISDVLPLHLSGSRARRGAESAQSLTARPCARGMDKGKGWYILHILWIWMLKVVWVFNLSHPEVGVFVCPLALEFTARVARIYGLKFRI